MEQLNLLNFVFSLARRFYVILLTSKIYSYKLVRQIRYCVFISYDFINLHSATRFKFIMVYMCATAFAIITVKMFHILHFA